MLNERRLPRSAGFTLLETMIALGVAVVGLAIVGNILVSSVGAVDQIMVDTSVEQDLKRGVSRLLRELGTSSTATIAIDTSNSSYDMATFQTPGTYSGSVTWGAIDTAGVWQSGWTVRYTVSSGTLVRRVLNGSGTQVGADETLVRTVDAVSGGVKGFRVTPNGPLYNVSVRVRKTFRDSKDYTKDFTSTVLVKNS